MTFEDPKIRDWTKDYISAYFQLDEPFIDKSKSEYRLDKKSDNILDFLKRHAFKNEAFYNGKKQDFFSYYQVLE